MAGSNRAKLGPQQGQIRAVAGPNRAKLGPHRATAGQIPSVLNCYGLIDNRLHHFLTDASWDATQINQRRLEVMNKCSQTRISQGFALIVDDTGHRKSGNFTSGVGRQYIGEIGKTDNGIVAVTTHLYDGKKSRPLDIELYQHANFLAQGNKDPEFKTKPDLAIALIDRSHAARIPTRYRPN